MRSCENPDIPCENRVLLCVAYKCIRAAKPSPFTIEINEGLFHKVERHGGYIVFHLGGSIQIYENGGINMDTTATAEQFNEILRVRAALGWTGKE
jgi:hypothetical protein